MISTGIMQNSRSKNGLCYSSLVPDKLQLRCVPVHNIRFTCAPWAGVWSVRRQFIHSVFACTAVLAMTNDQPGVFCVAVFAQHDEIVLRMILLYSYVIPAVVLYGCVIYGVQTEYNTKY